MVALIRLISVAVVLACLSNHSAVAETDRSLDTVLAKWEAATAKIKTLDAKVYCWRYDTFAFVSGREPQREEGRLYYEGPTSGCLHITSSNRAAWNGLSEMIVWRQKETLLIDGQRRTCDTYVWPIATPRDTNVDGGFVNRYREIFSALRWPSNFFPLTFDVHIAEVRKKYRLLFANEGDRFLITAIPKKSQTADCYSKVEVLVDAKTYLTTTVRCYSPNGKDHTDRQLANVKLNQRSSDRDKLLSPDLHGLTMQEYKSDEGGRQQ